MKWFIHKLLTLYQRRRHFSFLKVYPESRGGDVRKGQWGLNLSLRGTTQLSCGLRISLTSLPLPPGGFLGGSVVKNLPAKQETWI